jgi:glycosyltransferase 2 family protein
MTRTVVRTIFASCILVLLFWQLGLHTILDEIRTAELTVLALAYVVLVGDSFIRSYNWWGLLQSLSVAPSASGAWRCYLAGGFLGAVLPSTTSRDAARGLVAARWFGGSIGVYVASIVSLNALGLLAACTSGFIASLWLLMQEPRTSEALLVNAISGGGIAASVVAYLVMLKWRGLQRTQTEVPRSLLARFRNTAVRFSTSLLVFRNSSDLSRMFALALSSQVCRLLVLWLVSRAIGAGISLSHIALYGPLVVLVGLVPVSVGGFGGDQAAFVFFFARLGVDAHKAFVVSIIANALAMCLSLLGGLVYVLGTPCDRRPAADRLDTTLE